MKSNKLRVKPGKAKRWRKGQSGGTNPDTKTHREAAKGRFGNHLSQGRRNDSSAMVLTKDALASHDSTQKPTSLEDNHFDDETQSRTSFGNSSAHSLIETSHSVFGRVKRLWNSPEESHREICAVLAAVSEVVKAKSGMETETEYFAALLTALESSEEESSSAAIAFLLSVVMEKIHPTILEARFGLVSKILMTQLSENENTTSTALLKSLISCITTLLSVQPAAVWSDTSVQAMIQTVVNYTIHPKPRLRKSAQKGLVSILKEGGGVDVILFHPSCSLVFKQCQRMIGVESADTVKLHVLGLLKECLGNFPTKQIKGLCESILKLLTLGTSIMKMTGLQCLNGMFKTTAGPQGITAELNGQIISALYSHQPNLSDSQLLMAWSTVMENAHISLHRLNQSMSVAHLPKVFTLLTNCLLAKRKDVVKLVAQILKNILQTCISAIILELSEQDEMNKDREESDKYICLKAIFSIIETGLKYKYCEVWDIVLEVLDTFYGLVGDGNSFKFLRKSLQTLNELHLTPQFPYISELEAAFGTAIKSMGPRFVLNVVPLRLEENRDEPDFPQSWILPVLKSSVHKTDLTYYIEELLPLAGKMRTISDEWGEKGKQLERKLYGTLELQIWSLFPSFCKECTDISVSFPSIAKILGTALSDKPDICPIICQSIIHIIDQSKHNEIDRVQVSKFSKNFLPILFNLYTAERSPGAPQRDTVLNCIKSYLSITDDKLLDSLFSKLLSKLKDQETSSTHLRTALEDIVEVFVSFLSRDYLSKLFEFIIPILNSGNLTEQKKSYNLLNSVLSCDSLEHTAFIDNNLTQLQELLLGSLSTAGAGSKKPRLRCLIQIVSKIGPESSSFITAVTPEAVLCTKESNEKCRNIAYQLLKNLGYASQRCFEISAEESIQKYFSIILGGLKGSTHTVSATVGAMARLVYEFNDLLGSELISKLLSSVCVFFSAKSKEVVRSTLIFIKVVIGVLSPTELAPHVEELVTKILKWNENHKSHFRMKSRYILEKLTQKFSYEMVEEFVPDRHKRLLTHIRKMVERNKKLGKNKSNDAPKGDDEDYVKVKKRAGKPSFEELLQDSDEEDDTPTIKTNKGMWLQEGEDDNPLDFMDPSVTKRIIGTKPVKKSERSLNEFKIGLEGKMIIHEDDDEMMESSDNEDDEDMMMMMDDNKDQRLRRKRKLSDNGGKEQDSNGKPIDGGGGSGIYRKDPKKISFKDHGSEYRAKKAKGDMKKPGRPDPYAYIELDRQKLNRRKRAKLSGEFKTILHKAKKGAIKGRKQKKK